ncbi:PA14 domain-containing protein [Stenomitos frigidus]|uniref:PA14 domain-containing protein n=1 Tax=Stenomitos frigidus TaxID=1886765 RepID=UPI0015E64198|nr:PA14 domain-containing protein [Stenomitos frigidus]
MADSTVVAVPSSSALNTNVSANPVAASTLTTQIGNSANLNSSLTSSSTPTSAAATTPIAAPAVNQLGLRAQYYQGKDFTNLKWSQIDPNVNFTWGTNAPNSIVPADNFAVRWTGQVQPKYSEAYTFYTRSDDGIRLWVNGQLLIDNWTDHDLIENSGAITLAAGQAYDIKLEYYDSTGGATSQLLWSSPTQAKEIVPASQLFQGISTLAFATGEPAKSANAFVDSIGINTHIRYYDTAYGNYPFIKQSLLDLGVRHIRDGGSDPTWIQRINELGSLGIKSTLVLDPNIGIGPDASYDIKPPGYTVANFVKNLVATGVEAVEILNEFDLFSSIFAYSRNGQPVTGNGWISYVRDFTRDVYIALKSDPATAKIPIIGPSFVYSTSTSAVGDLSQWVDYGNFHPYNNPKNPGDGSLAKDYALRSQAFGTKPLIATEVGYSTGSATSDRPVTEAVQGKYIPRLFLESFNLGVPRTFSYELIDQKADPNNSENNYGLIRSDGTPKPAYTVLKNLIGLLNDPQPAATVTTPVVTTPTPLGALNYSIGGTAQNVHHTLLQKSNGEFYLVLWVEVPSTDQSVSQSVTLNFNTALGQATTYAPSQSIAPVAAYASPTQLTLNVTDAPLVVKLSAPVTAAAAATASLPAATALTPV